MLSTQRRSISGEFIFLAQSHNIMPPLRAATFLSLLPSWWQAHTKIQVRVAGL